MAKKAPANGKASAKISAKPSGKSSASASKKPSKATASAKTVTVKADKGKPPAKAVKPAEVKKSTSEKKPGAAAPLEATKKPEAAKKSTAKILADKPAQATETSEKIKIDKSMTEDQAKWAEMYNKYRDSEASAYDMRGTFKASSAIQHKILGWGWVVSNENDRLEVLFKDGKRMLISNYSG